jgi:hypothetical protein
MRGAPYLRNLDSMLYSIGLDRYAMRAVRPVINHILEGRYQGIIVSGSSAQHTKELLRNADLPPIYDLGTVGNKLLYRPRINFGISENERTELFEQWLSQAAPELQAIRDQSLIYVDDHARSGSKIRQLRREFPELGFPSVSMAVFVAGSEVRQSNNPPFVGAYDDFLLSTFSKRTYTSLVSPKEQVFLDRLS